MRTQVIGASFGHSYLASLGIPLSLAFKAYGSLPFTWIRLGTYWSEVESAEGEYNYTTMQQLLRRCTAEKLHVVMTVGMKAPRWPEYYIPPKLTHRVTQQKKGVFDVADSLFTDKLLTYIKTTVQELGQYACIKCWQVENEPLDPSGPQQFRITEKLLEKEVALVRHEDPTHPIIVNLWGNELGKRKYYKAATRLADIVGLDMYPRVPTSFLKRTVYRGPSDKDNVLNKIIDSIKEQGRQVWITELQAEPWGKEQSCSPRHLVENTRWAKTLHADGLFFWGFEHWLKEQINGNSAYWDEAQKAIKTYLIP